MSGFAKSLVLAFLLLAIAPTSKARTLYIKADGTGDAPNVQAGVDAADNGDIVLLAPGTFTGLGNRDIDFKGKTITVESETDATKTIIDCQGVGRAFLFTSSENRSAILRGLTITNGLATTGGAVYISGAAPTIAANVFVANTATSSGGAIYVLTGSPTIRNNVIMNNGASIGGGIYAANAFPTVTGNTIVENGATTCGGIFFLNSFTVLERNIIAFSSEGEAVVCAISPSVTLQCNVIFGNVGGDGLCGLDGGNNFIEDPQFCGAQGTGNVFLQSDSRAAASNNACGERIGAMPVSCSTTAVDHSTWGRVKALYRSR